MRPPELSDDHTGTIPVVAHAVGWMGQHVGPVEFACCLYATAPFVRAQDLRQGLDVLQLSGAQYAFSVTSYAFPIQRAIRIRADERVEMLNPEHFNTRSQDLEEVFHDAGQFYWGLSNAWLNHMAIFSRDSVPVRLPRERVQDIDNPEDWTVAELKFRLMSEN
jgi:N-acylneuraminate cytidylyltransferase